MPAGINEYALGLELQLETNAEQILGSIQDKIGDIQAGLEQVSQVFQANVQAVAVGLDDVVGDLVIAQSLTQDIGTESAATAQQLNSAMAELAAAQQDLTFEQSLENMEALAEALQQVEQLTQTAIDNVDPSVLDSAGDAIAGAAEQIYDMYDEHIKDVDTATKKYNIISKIFKADSKVLTDQFEEQLKRQKSHEQVMKVLQSTHKISKDDLKTWKEKVGVLGDINDRVRSQQEALEGSMESVSKMSKVWGVMRKGMALMLIPLHKMKSIFTDLLDQQEKWHTLNYQIYGGMNAMADRATRLSATLGVSREEANRALSALADAGVAKDSIDSLAAANVSLAYSTGAANESIATYQKLMNSSGIAIEDVNANTTQLLNAQRHFGLSAKAMNTILTVSNKNLITLKKQFGTDAVNQYSKSITMLAAAARQTGVDVGEVSDLMNRLTNDAMQFVVALGQDAIYKSPNENLKSLALKADDIREQFERWPPGLAPGLLRDLYGLTTGQLEMLEVMGEVEKKFAKMGEESKGYLEDHRERWQESNAAIWRSINQFWYKIHALGSILLEPLRDALMEILSPFKELISETGLLGEDMEPTVEMFKRWAGIIRSIVMPMAKAVSHIIATKIIPFVKKLAGGVDDATKRFQGWGDKTKQLHDTLNAWWEDVEKLPDWFEKNFGFKISETFGVVADAIGEAWAASKAFVDYFRERPYQAAIIVILALGLLIWLFGSLAAAVVAATAPITTFVLVVTLAALAIGVAIKIVVDAFTDLVTVLAENQEALPMIAVVLGIATLSILAMVYAVVVLTAALVALGIAGPVALLPILVVGALVIATILSLGLAISMVLNQMAALVEIVGAVAPVIGGVLVKVLEAVSSLFEGVGNTIMKVAKAFGVLGEGISKIPLTAGARLASLSAGLATLIGTITAGKFISFITGDPIKKIKELAIALSHLAAAAATSATAMVQLGELGDIEANVRTAAAHSIVEVKMKEDLGRTTAEAENQREQSNKLGDISEVLEALVSRMDDMAADMNSLLVVTEENLPDMVDNLEGRAARGSGGRVNSWG